MAGIKVAAAMFTAAQCLAKADDLEQKAARPLPQDASEEYRAMAREWRRLACRALVQDQRAMRVARTPEA
jgi:Na+-transporting NADH:ubiquinone oxidoreductase subunit NqrF